MKNLVNIHEEYGHRKEKKVWRKPCLKLLSFVKTNENEGPGNDYGSPGAAGS